MLGKVKNVFSSYFVIYNFLSSTGKHLLTFCIICVAILHQNKSVVFSKGDFFLLKFTIIYFVVIDDDIAYIIYFAIHINYITFITCLIFSAGLGWTHRVQSHLKILSTISRTMRLVTLMSSVICIHLLNN